MICTNCKSKEIKHVLSIVFDNNFEIDTSILRPGNFNHVYICGDCSAIIKVEKLTEPKRLKFLRELIKRSI